MQTGLIETNPEWQAVGQLAKEASNDCTEFKQWVKRLQALQRWPIVTTDAGKKKKDIDIEVDSCHEPKG